MSEILSSFLEDLRNKNRMIIIWTMNGYRLYGTVSDFDDAVVMLNSQSGKKMVLRSAISTIMAPEHPEKYYGDGEKDED